MHRLLLALPLCLAACAPQPSPANLSGYWGYEGELDTFAEREVLYLAADGGYRIYPGNDRPIETGTWDVAGATLELSGGAGALPIADFKSDRMTLTRAGAARVYERTPRCPPLNFRSGDGPYAVYFTFSGTERNSGYSGFLATDFDSEGELHAIVGAVAPDAPEPVYATTRGDGCGLRTFAFPNHGHARLLIDPSDTMHVAFAQVKGAATSPALTLTYATRPALQAEATWKLTELRANTFVPPLVAFARHEDDRLAIVATDDEGRLVAFRRSTASDEFASASIPSDAKLPDELAVAFDAGGLVHVLALYPSPATLELFSETASGWSRRTLDLPNTAPGGANLLGVDFLIEGDRWLVALGDLGTPSVGATPGKLGPLFLGTLSASAQPAWRAIGVGGRARLARDELQRLHVTSYSRMMGSTHTILDGERIERFVGNGGFNPWEPPALATGPGGRVAMGTSVSIAVMPPAASFKPYRRPLTVTVEGGAGAIETVVPPSRCTASCTVDTEPGRLVEILFKGEGLHFPTSVRGPERLPLFCVDALGACLQTVASTPQNSGVDARGPTVVATFARHLVSGVEHLGTAFEGWTSTARPAAVSALPALALTRRSGQPLSVLRRWDAGGAPLPPIEVDDWTMYSTVVAPDGAVYVSGRVTASTTIGTESGFLQNSEVLVRLDASTRVDFVKRLPSGTFTGPLMVNDDGVATLTQSQLLRWSPTGDELPSTVVRASLAAAAPRAVYVATPGTDTTTLATVDSAGALQGSTGVTGVVYALSVDSAGLPVALLFAKPNTQVGGASVGAAGGMLVVGYDAEWGVRWRSPTAALEAQPTRSHLALVGDRRAVAVTQSHINALAAAAFSDTAALVFPPYGGTGRFADTGGTVQLFGVTRAGAAIAAWAGVTGAVDFRVAKVDTPLGSQLPVRLLLSVPESF